MDRLNPLLDSLRTLAFLWVAGTVVAISSERMFWFWETSPLAQLEGGMFYALAVAAALWIMHRRTVRSWPMLVLASTVFAYVVEGVITPVLYSGGPFVPFFPLWFTAWHGLISLCLLLFGVRWMLLHGRARMLATTSLGLGTFWGLWLTTSALPEQLEDPDLLAGHDELHLLSTLEFAVYVATFAAMTAACHWLLGFLWPERSTQSRTFSVVVPGLCLLGAAGWTAVILWALPMFIGYVLLTDRLLARFPTSHEPTLLEQLHGRISLRSTAPLLVMAPAAVTTYAAVNAMDPSETALNVIYYGTILVQTLVTAAVLIWATRAYRGQALRSSADTSMKEAAESVASPDR